MFNFAKRDPAVKLSNTDEEDQALLFMPSLYAQLSKCEPNTSAYEHSSAHADSARTRLCQAYTALKLHQGTGQGLGSYGTDRHHFSFLESSSPKPGRKI